VTPTPTAGGLVLASKSVARRAVLAGAGVPFEAHAPGVDEDAVKTAMLARAAGPRAIAAELAERKALKVSDVRPELVLGADQTLELAGALYDKVATMAEARTRLDLLRNKPHQLH